VKRDRFDLWAVALMPDADKATIQQELGANGLDMSDDGETEMAESNKTA
jgi:hypothetical protein